MTLTYGSLFAGIGGFDLGFDRAGMVGLWQVEIDPYCTSVLEKHWPTTRRYKDVRDCGRGRKHQLEPVDVICGGPPCQPFSKAGEQRGAEDDRNLWPEFACIIVDLRPSWVVFENVVGIRKIYLDTVLSDLERLGYTYASTVIPACAFDAPHRRDRIWVVAHTKEHTIGAGLREGESREEWQRRLSDGRGTAMADTPGERLPEPETAIQQFASAPVGRRSARGETRAIGDIESRLGGMANGFPHWLDEPRIPRTIGRQKHRRARVRVLGNAVVPQVTEFIGSLIMEVEKE